MLILGLLGVALLAWSNLDVHPTTAPPAPDTSGEPAAEGRAGAGVTGEEYAAKLEETLARTLSGTAGAGEVRVHVFLESGPRFEYARKTTEDTRTTQESDRTGTSRVTSEQHEEGEVTLMRGATSGQDQPVVVVTHLPAVRGVLVVASGAADPVVRAELAKAVQTALNLAPHRVRVLAKEGEQW